MKWIRIDRGMPDDPRLAQLAAACRVRIPEAVGLCVAVLAQLPDHAREGDLTDVPDATIERWAGWHGKRGAFAAAFTEILCAQRVVRAWEKHNGAAMREADAAKVRADEWRKKRKSNGNGTAYGTENVRRTERESFASTGRDVTGRTTTTQQDQLPPAAAQPAPRSTSGPRTPTVRPEPKYPHFPKATCDALHTRWGQLVGAVKYARFRKALGELYPTAAVDWNDRDALGTLELYATSRQAQFRTPEDLAAQWRTWLDKFRAGPESWGRP